MLGGACLCYTMDFCPLISDVEGDGANPKHRNPTPPSTRHTRDNMDATSQTKTKTKIRTSQYGARLHIHFNFFNVAFMFLALDCLHSLPTMPPQPTPFERAPPEPYTNNLPTSTYYTNTSSTSMQPHKIKGVAPSLPTRLLPIQHSNPTPPDLDLDPNTNIFIFNRGPTRLTNIDSRCCMAPSSATLLCAHSLPLSSTQRAHSLSHTHPIISSSHSQPQEARSHTYVMRNQSPNQTPKASQYQEDYKTYQPTTPMSTQETKPPFTKNHHYTHNHQLYKQPTTSSPEDRHFIPCTN